MADIRSRLLVARGSSFLSKSFTNKVAKNASEGATNFVILKPVSDVQMGISYQVGSDYSPLTDALSVAPDALGALAFDFTITSEDAAPYAEAMLKLVGSVSATNISACKGYEILRPEPGVMRLVFFLGESDMFDIIPAFPVKANAALKFGWNLGTIGEKEFDITLGELLNVELSATLDTLPFDATELLPALIGKISEMGLPVDDFNNAPGVADVNSGKFNTTVDFTMAITKLFESLAETLPVPVSLDSNISDTVTELAPMFLLSGDPRSRRAAMQNISTADQAMDVLKMFITRDIRTIKGVHAELKGKYGMSIDLLNFFSPDTIAGFIKGAVGVAAKIAKDLPMPTDEEIAEYDAQQLLELQGGEGDGEDDEVIATEAADGDDEVNYED